MRGNDLMLYLFSVTDDWSQLKIPVKGKPARQKRGASLDAQLAVDGNICEFVQSVVLKLPVSQKYSKKYSVKPLCCLIIPKITRITDFCHNRKCCTSLL